MSSNTYTQPTQNMFEVELQHIDSSLIVSKIRNPDPFSFQPKVTTGMYLYISKTEVQDIQFSKEINPQSIIYLEKIRKLKKDAIIFKAVYIYQTNQPSLDIEFPFKWVKLDKFQKLTYLIHFHSLPSM